MGLVSGKHDRLLPRAVSRLTRSHRVTERRTDTYVSPLWLKTALRDAGARFDLDPCAALNQPWHMADKSYTEKEDGLVQPWHGEVWLNPPYHRGKVPKWMQRMSEHGRGMALVFARTDVDWFKECVWKSRTAQGLLFLYGRLVFAKEDGTSHPHNAGAPSVLAAYGGISNSWLKRMKAHGHYIPLYHE